MLWLSLLTIVSAMGAVTLFGQEGQTKAGEGTLMVAKKTYPLTHALAYETMIDGEEARCKCLPRASPGTNNKVSGSVREAGQTLLSARDLLDRRRPFGLRFEYRASYFLRLNRGVGCLLYLTGNSAPSAVERRIFPTSGRA